MISDGGGAVVIAAADVARDCKKTPVWILGTGEATKYPENGGDITVSAARQSGPPAFGEAGVKPGEIDIAMIYDSFSITVLTLLEDLGFCKKGEGGAYVTGGRLRFDRRNDGPALNTDGGGLSSNHPGMRGIFTLDQATRQLRGESTSQVKARALAVAHGAARHAGQPAQRRHRDSGEIEMADFKRPLPNLKEHDTLRILAGNEGRQTDVPEVRRLRRDRVLSAPPLHSVPRQQSVVAHGVGTRHGLQFQRGA
jgi:hypothetical protein